MAEIARRPLPFKPTTRLALPRTQGKFELFEDLLCAAIPASYCIEFNLVGRMFANELFLLLLLPFLIFKRGNLLKQPLPRTVLTLGVAWLVSQVITDLFRGVEPQDFLRGWAKIAFTLTDFSSAYLLLNRVPRRFFLFAFGLTTGSLLQIFVDPNIAFDVESWKFGYAYPLTEYGVLIVVVVAAIRGSQWITPVVILGLLGAVNFQLGTRSTGMILFMSAGFLLFKEFGRNFLVRQTKLAIVSALILGGLGLAAIIQGYDYAASSGLLGSEALEKYETQTAGDLPLILSGRPQVVGAILAIADSPVLGHGSWAKDREYVIQLMQTMQRLGVDFKMTRDDDEYQELIPSHSHLLGAWVEAGVLGAVFWAFALVVTGRALLTFLLSPRNWLDALIVKSILSITWSILFSPYGAEERFFTTFELVIMMWVVQLPRSKIDRGAAAPGSQRGRQSRLPRPLKEPIF